MTPQIAEYRDCPNCDTPVMRGPTLWRSIRWLCTPDARIEPCSDSVPIGPGWLEYTTTGHQVWMVHDRVKCAYAARTGCGSSLQ